MSKYKQYFDEMLIQNEELFSTFETIHNNYIINPDAWQEKLNNVGKEVMDIIKDYEDRLVAKQEGGKYSKFSTQTSEKFWSEIRTKYPKIDFVGVKISYK